MAAFADGDIDEVYDIITSEDFSAIMQNHSGSLDFDSDEDSFFHDVETLLSFDYGNTVDGIGFSVSFDSRRYPIHVHAFYGEWQNGLANGDGIAFYTRMELHESIYYTMARSHWIEGLANGETVVISAESSPQSVSVRTSVLTGTQERGLWQGELIEVRTTEFIGFADETRTERLRATFVDGLPMLVSPNDDITIATNINTDEPTLSGVIPNGRYYSNILFSRFGSEEYPEEMYTVTSLPWRLSNGLISNPV
jgi:hypothetical protein